MTMMYHGIKIGESLHSGGLSSKFLSKGIAQIVGWVCGDDEHASPALQIELLEAIQDKKLRSLATDCRTGPEMHSMELLPLAGLKFNLGESAGI